MRPLDLAQRQIFANGTGVEIDQAQESAALASALPIQKAGDELESVAEDRNRPALVGVGQGREVQGAAAQMIMMLGIGVPARLQGAKAVEVAELGVDQRQQMVPAEKRLVVGVAVAPRDDRVETPPVERLDEGGKNGRAVAHAPHPIF